MKEIFPDKISHGMTVLAEVRTEHNTGKQD